MSLDGKAEFPVSDSAFPARHEGSGAVEGETSQSLVDEENNNNNTDLDCAMPCMPLNESFHDVCPPITECFKCDVEEYEHEHEIGQYKYHHHLQKELYFLPLLFLEKLVTEPPLS